MQVARGARTPPFWQGFLPLAVALGPPWGPGGPKHWGTMGCGGLGALRWRWVGAALPHLQPQERGPAGPWRSGGPGRRSGCRGLGGLPLVPRPRPPPRPAPKARPAQRAPDGSWASASPPQDSVAERSKAVAQGAIPKGRGFEPHRCQGPVTVWPWPSATTHVRRGPRPFRCPPYAPHLQPPNSPLRPLQTIPTALASKAPDAPRRPL